jgi:hypothetical protein
MRRVTATIVNALEELAGGSIVERRRVCGDGRGRAERSTSTTASREES